MKYTPLDDITVGCSYISEVDHSINSEIFRLFYYCIQSAIFGGGGKAVLFVGSRRLDSHASCFIHEERISGHYSTAEWLGPQLVCSSGSKTYQPDQCLRGEGAARKGARGPNILHIQGSPKKKCIYTLTKENSTLYNRLL